MVMMMMITEIMLLRKSFGRRPPRYVVVIIVSERTSSTSLLRPEWVYRLLSSLVTWRTRSTQRRGGSIISSSRRWLRSLLQSLFSSMGLQQAREEVTPGFSFFSLDGLSATTTRKVASFSAAWLSGLSFSYSYLFSFSRCSFFCVSSFQFVVISNSCIVYYYLK